MVLSESADISIIPFCLCHDTYCPISVYQAAQCSIFFSQMKKPTPSDLAQSRNGSHPSLHKYAFLLARRAVTLSDSANKTVRKWAVTMAKWIIRTNQKHEYHPHNFMCLRLFEAFSRLFHFQTARNRNTNTVVFPSRCLY